MLAIFFLCCVATLVNRCIAGYVLKDDYTPSDFFNMFSFFTADDPTHGFVDYVDQNTAQAAGLVSTTSTGVYIGVDSDNVTPNGRPSVRLTSNKAYNHGLIILDLDHMPEGCGTWPAFWMVGPNWPNNGEIDIIEGVNDATTNSMTLHTGPDCSITNNNLFSGTINTPQCYVYAPGQDANSGCSIGAANSNTYGSGFNANGGGVYATEWTSDAISVYFFPAGNVPQDITSGSPDPATWGEPVAMFQGGCDLDSSIQNQQIVFDMTFCGDWAGAVWSSSSCASQASTCNDFVANNPSAFQNAYWSINSLRVYQDNGESTPDPPTYASTPTSAPAYTTTVAASAWSSLVATSQTIVEPDPATSMNVVTSVVSSTSSEITTAEYFTSSSESASFPTSTSIQITTTESSTSSSETTSTQTSTSITSSAADFTTSTSADSVPILQTSSSSSSSSSKSSSHHKKHTHTSTDAASTSSSIPQSGATAIASVGQSQPGDDNIASSTFASSTTVADSSYGISASTTALVSSSPIATPVVITAWSTDVPASSASSESVSSSQPFTASYALPNTTSIAGSYNATSTVVSFQTSTASSSKTSGIDVNKTSTFVSAQTSELSSSAAASSLESLFSATSESTPGSATTSLTSDPVTSATSSDVPTFSPTNNAAAFTPTAATPSTTSSSTTSDPTTTDSPITTPSPLQAPLHANCTSFHYVQLGEDCLTIINNYNSQNPSARISLEQFLAWNPVINAQCTNMWADYYVCTSVDVDAESEEEYYGYGDGGYDSSDGNGGNARKWKRLSGASVDSVYHKRWEQDPSQGQRLLEVGTAGEAVVEARDDGNGDEAARRRERKTRGRARVHHHHGHNHGQRYGHLH